MTQTYERLRLPSNYHTKTQAASCTYTQFSTGSVEKQRQDTPPGEPEGRFSKPNCRGHLGESKVAQ